MPLGKGEERIIGFALFGAPMLASQGNRFAPYEMRLSAEYATAVGLLGAAYQEAVKDQFQRTHGRSGKTAASVASMWSPNVPAITAGAPAVYTVKMGGHIGAVINPLPTHTIEVSNKQILSNFKSNPGYWPGREINYYSLFGPTHKVTWFQGGEESYSPDRTWYTEGPVRDLLVAGSIESLHNLAGKSQTLWYDELGGHEVFLAGDEVSL